MPGGPARWEELAAWEPPLLGWGEPAGWENGK
jgi:hypothetical protein